MESYKINKIKINKNKTILFFDHREKIEISNEVLTSFYLYQGKEISEEDIHKILLKDKTESLKKYAISLCKKGPISEWKLREKLYAKNAGKEEVNLLLHDLKYAHLIDDQAMMKDVMEYLNSKNYGENKIKEYLASKGIFQENIDQLSFDYAIELKKAKNVLKSLNNKYEALNYEQRKLHIYHALMNRGFVPEVVNEVIQGVTPKNERQELVSLKKDYLKAKSHYEKKYNGKELKDKIISSLLMKGYPYNDIVKVGKQ